MIIGLTGGIGAGKSTIANLFKNLGVPIFSTDDIAREILDTDKNVQQSIITKFGTKCLNANNTINRHALRKIIFTNKQSRLWLETLLHPMIARKFIASANNRDYPYCIVEIPLLIEAKMQDKVDRILTVDCNEEQQLKQALVRGHHNESEIKAIIANQITRSHRLAESNDIIENTYDLVSIQTRVKELHNLYLSLAANKNH